MTAAREENWVSVDGTTLVSRRTSNINFTLAAINIGGTRNPLFEK